MKEKYYINEKTHLATEKKCVLHHSLKINKRGCPNKLRGGGGGSEKNRKINKRPLISKPVYLGPSILEMSKPVMYEFWYDFVKPK